MANLIGNGSMIGHADGWCATVPTVAAVVNRLASPTRSVGGGCLTVAHSSAVDVHYRPGGDVALPLADLADPDTLDCVAYGRLLAAGPAVTLEWLVLFYNDPSCRFESQVGSSAPSAQATITDAAWTACELRDQAVPVGATHVVARLVTGNLAGAGMAITDAYVGDVDGDAPPYPAADAVPLRANRVANPGAETSLGGWFIWNGDETLTRETGSPIAGTGSFAVTTTDAYGGQGVGYGSPNDYGIVVVPGETLRLSFSARGAGADILAFADYQGASDADLWGAVLGASAASYQADVRVPAGAQRLKALYFATEWSTPQNATFYLDDVSLGRSPAPGPGGGSGSRGIAIRIGL